MKILPSVDFYKPMIIRINYIIYTVLFFLFFSFSLSANNIDSLKLQLEESSGSNQIDVLIQLSKAYWTISPSNGIFYANEAVNLLKKFPNQQKEAKALLYAGVNAWFMGSYDEAIGYYQSSLTIACEIDDKRLCAYNLNNLGMVNTYLKNYEEAITNYTKSSKMIDELGDKIEYAKIQNNIAGLKMNLGDPDKALELNLLALEIIEKSDEQIFLIWLYNDIGTVYNKQGNVNRALLYYNKALQLSNELNNTLGKSKTMNLMGNVYLENKDYDKANKYFFDALKHAQVADAKDDINITYKNISNYFAAVGNFKKSLEYYKFYKEISDSTINENKLRTIIEMQSRYALESAENENQLLQKNLEIKELTIKKNNTQRTFLIISLLMTTILIVLFYNRLIIRKKKNKELNEKNAIISKQKHQLSKTLAIQHQLNETLREQKEQILSVQKNLEQINKELEESNATKDKFFSIIAHDLRGPISDILSLSTLIQENQDRYTPEELNRFFTLTKSAAQCTHELLENLLTWARSQRNEIAYEPGLYDLKEILEDTIAIFKLKATDKKLIFINNCTRPCICYFDKNMVKNTITNLINNATKFTNKGGKIEIDAQIIENQVRLSICDNGVGMRPEVKEKLFNINSKQPSQKGTDGEKGTGLGLILCKELIKKHKGEIWAESELGNGSTFYFTIPYDCEEMRLSGAFESNYT